MLELKRLDQKMCTEKRKAERNKKHGETGEKNSHLTCRLRDVSTLCELSQSVF